MTSDDPKQRLLSVFVGEVSLVDHPANEEEFLLMKSLEQSGLTGAAALEMLDNLVAKSTLEDADKAALRTFIAAKHALSEVKLANKVEKVEKAELDAFTAMTVTLNAARDRLWRVSNELAPDKLADAGKEMERIKTMIDAASEHAQNITKAITDFTDGFKAFVAKASEDGADGKKKLPPWMKEHVKKLVAAIKEMDTDDEDDTAKTEKANANVDAVINKDGSVVLKGGKQFSKERLSKLKEATAALVGTLKDADPDGYNDFVATFAPTPGHVAAVAQATGNATSTQPTQKSATPDEPPSWAKDLMAVVNKSADSLKSVTDRLEAVEKAGAVPKALDTNVTEGKPVQKQASIWKNIL